jgi:hypothetical protein
LNRTIEHKTYELKQKEQHLFDCGREIQTLQSQVDSFIAELNQLKALEMRYKEENFDI